MLSNEPAPEFGGGFNHIWLKEQADTQAFFRSPSTASSGLSNELQDDVGKVRFAADAGGVPDFFAVALGRVAPGWLALLHTIPHDALGQAQHHRDVFVRVQAVADEKGHHDNILG